MEEGDPLELIQQQDAQNIRAIQAQHQDEEAPLDMDEHYQGILHKQDVYAEVQANRKNYLDSVLQSGLGNVDDVALPHQRYNQAHDALDRNRKRVQRLEEHQQ